MTGDKFSQWGRVGGPRSIVYAFFSEKVRAITTDIKILLTTTPLTTLTALTVDEKRARIFNVGEPFEVLAKKFDEELRPLVSNF